METGDHSSELVPPIVDAASAKRNPVVLRSVIADAAANVQMLAKAKERKKAFDNIISDFVLGGFYFGFLPKVFPPQIFLLLLCLFFPIFQYSIF